MATGRPIIAAFDEESELCNIVKKNNVGINVEPENPKALVSAIAKLKADRVGTLKKGRCV